MTNILATRGDIDEVLDVIQTFMHQVDKKFSHLESRQNTLEDKFDKLLNTI
jgi:hypothetical protein